MGNKKTLEIIHLSIKKGFKSKPSNGHRIYFVIDLSRNSIAELHEVKNKDDIYHITSDSELQKWLRDIHNIHIEILVDKTTSPKYCYEISKFEGDPDNLSEDCFWRTELQYKNTEFVLERTYEDALQNALLEALQLIK